MSLRPPRPKRTDTPFPDTTLFRSFPRPAGADRVHMERAFVPAKSLGIAGDKQRHQSASPKAKQDGENQWQLATVGIDGGTDDHVIGPPPIRNGAALDI